MTMKAEEEFACYQIMIDYAYLKDDVHHLYIDFVALQFYQCIMFMEKMLVHK
jgi:hypothetical protein